MLAYSVNGAAWEGLAALQARWLGDAVHGAMLFVSGESVSRRLDCNYRKSARGTYSLHADPVM